jgi:hypothetical protein
MAAHIRYPREGREWPEVSVLHVCFGMALTWLHRFLDTESFVNAIAPRGDVKIGRDQWSILFRVADKSRRGLVSWDDFLVFETSLKRPDADYWVAFQFFDVYGYRYSSVIPSLIT